MEDRFGTYTEEKIVDPTNVLLCFLLAVAVVLFILGSIKTFNMDHYDSVVLAVSTVFVYGLVVYVLLMPKTVRRGVETKVERVEVIKTVEKPMIQKIETTIEKPAEKPIEDIFRPPFEKTIEKPIEPIIEKPIEEPKPVIIEKPVIKTVEKPVLNHITIESPRKVLDIPKYAYRGSSETKTYHKVTCRLSKSIKNKYKVSANDPKYFIKRGYTACKSCIDKPRKGAKRNFAVSKTPTTKLPKLKEKVKVKKR